MRDFLLIGGLMVLLTVGYYGWQSNKPPPKYMAVAGRIDLREMDWHKGPVALHGEWLFQRKYDGGSKSQPVVAPVPGLWNGLPTDEETMPARGIGYYSLDILLPPLEDRPPGPLAISFIDVLPNAFWLFVNGKRSVPGGRWNEDLDKMKFVSGAHFGRLPPGKEIGDSIHLEVQLANGIHRKGGMLKSIAFGPERPIEWQRTRARAEDMAIISLLLPFAIFNLALFFFFAREWSFLYYALFCVAAALRVGFAGENLLGFAFVELPWWWVQRMRYLSPVVGFALYSPFLRTFYPNALSRRTSQVLVFSGIALSFLFVVVPTYQSTFLAPLIPVYAFIGMIVMQAALLRARRLGYQSTGYLIAGGWAVTLAAINDFLVANQFIVGEYKVGFGLLVMAGCQAILTIRYFSEIFHRNAELAAELNEANIGLEKKVEERTHDLAGKNEELIGMQRFKERITSMLVHDLKSPLQIIISRSQPEKGGDQNIYSAARRMLMMAQNMLDVDRAKQRGFQLRLEAIPLEDLIAASIQRLRSLADEKGIHIDHSAGECPRIFADRTLTERCLDNVIQNAIKYSLAESTVTVGCSVVSGGAVVAVGDQGPGIPETRKVTIFEDYESSGDTSTSHGLGLSFVRLAMEEMAGSVMVMDGDKVGSTFLLTFPLAGTFSDEIAGTAKIPTGLYAIIAPQKEVLLATPLFDISEIKRLLESPPLNVPELEGWREAVLRAAYASDGEKYIRLMEESRNT